MIIQVGPYPPPLGGISVYIKRMKRYLDSKKIDNRIWDISIKADIPRQPGIRSVNLKYIPYYFWASKDIDVIHYNICGKKAKYFISFFNEVLFANRKKVITIHGDSSELYDGNDFFMTRALNSFDAIICVKAGDRKFLMSKGVRKNIYEIAAYINPIEEEQDKKNIPEKVWEFMDRSKFVISANGCIRFHKGEELYGIDMLIDLVYKLNNHGMDVSLIFALVGIENLNQNEKEYYEVLKGRISTYDLKDKIFIFEVRDTEFYPILQRSDLFIRPTNTDGDAVSLREALYFKIPSIASDIILRPKGTILFHNRNHKDLEEKVMYLIRNYDQYKKLAENISIQDHSEDVLDIYQRLSYGNP